jgi:4-amino-4-deoxy-L-arabinose transferase-like glycosyltransferase
MTSSEVLTRLQPVGHRLPRVTAGVLLLLFVCIGLTGHDPWKADEAYTFGIVYSMIASGDWVVPTLAGEAFVEKPPLVYMLAALMASITSAWLPLHDGARLASGVLSATTLVATAMSARTMFGAGHGRLAALVLAGSLGYVMHARMLLTDLGVVAGVAVALHGFVMVHARRRVLKPGALIGVGAGIAFLSKGLVGIAALLAMAVLLPVVFRVWRTSRYVYALLIASLFALPWVLVWTVALYLHSPTLFYEWFWMNNVGRFFGFAVSTLGAAHEPGFLLETIPWFTFPALPLMLLAWWRNRTEWRDSPGVQAGSMFVLLYTLMLVMSSSARANYLLPVLPALAMLAAPAATMLPRSINRIGTAATLSVFVAVALFVWIVWAIAVSQGNPPDWPLLTKHLPRDQPFVWATYPFVLATLLTSLLVAIVVVHRRTPSRLLTSWCAGILLFGVAASQLWMPWIDAAKSYREPFTQMRAHLPYDQYCLSRHAVGESERGLLHYFLGAIPTRYQANAEAMCPFVLVQGFQHDASALHAFHNPRVLWRGARRGDQREQFWLLDLRNEAEASVPLKDMAMGGAEEAIAKRQLALALFARRLPVVENDRAQKY